MTEQHKGGKAPKAGQSGDRKPSGQPRKPGQGSRKPSGKAGAPGDRERKPYRRKDEAPQDRERKPSGKPEFSQDRERKPYRPKGDTPRDGERKPYRRKDEAPQDGERRPYRSADEAPRERKPSGKPGFSQDRERKPYRKPGTPGDRDRKPYGEPGVAKDRESRPFGPGNGPGEGAPQHSSSADQTPRRSPAAQESGAQGARPGAAPRRTPAYEGRGPAGMGRKPGGRPQSMTEELTDLEFEIANLVARRTALLGRSAKARVDKGLPLADPNQERTLRRAWDVVAGREGLEVGPLRGIFTLANGLAYAQATKPEVGRKAFYFSPHVKDLDLTMAGPRSLVRTRLWAAVAAVAGADCTLAPIVLNDPLVELVKALNQAGAGLAWEGGTVRCQGGALGFADRTVFAGADLLNLYLLLALALPQVGRMTFTGGAALKVHDLGPAAGVFAGLGARLTALEPYTPGLPARLESGGMTHNTFHVPDALPAEAAVALALAGPTYPDGIRFTWGPEWTGAPLLAHAAAVLRACGVPCELTGGGFSVARGTLAVPAAPAGQALPLDPLLAASLLAVPRLAGGRVALSGAWPGDDPLASPARALLAASGLELDFSPTVAAARSGPWPEAVELDATDPALVPLAVALGLGAPGDTRILVDERGDAATAEIVAERAGRFARVKPGRIVIVAGQGAGEWADAERRMSSPSATWTLALALVSLRTPNIGLANPGGLAEVWPGFISLFADNFTVREKEPEPDDTKKKGRPVRLDCGGGRAPARRPPDLRDPAPAGDGGGPPPARCREPRHRRLPRSGDLPALPGEAAPGHGNRDPPPPGGAPAHARPPARTPAISHARRDACPPPPGASHAHEPDPQDHRRPPG